MTRGGEVTFSSAGRFLGKPDLETGETKVIKRLLPYG